MIHLSEGELQAFLDGELSAAEHARFAAHLGDCAACRAELQALRDSAALISRAFAAVDVPPDVAIARATVYRRARPARPVLRLLPQHGGRTLVVRRAVLRAAVLVLFAAGAASAAVPHWPLRHFLVGLWHDAARLVGPRPTPPPTPVIVRIAPPPLPPTPVPPSGVSVLPQNGRVRVFVRHAAPGLLVHVRVLDTDRASVEAEGPATSAHFATGPGRIEVTGAGAGDIRIDIPRSADHVSIEIGDRTVFTRDAGRTRRLDPATTSASETIFRVT